MDPAHVANVLDRTMDAFKEAHGLDSPAERQGEKKARAMPAFAGVEEKDDVDIQQSKAGTGLGAGSPEQWIYPSGTAPLRGQGHRGPENDKDDEEGSAEGKEDKSYINDQGNPDGMPRGAGFYTNPVSPLKLMMKNESSSSNFGPGAIQGIQGILGKQPQK